MKAYTIAAIGLLLMVPIIGGFFCGERTDRRDSLNPFPPDTVYADPIVLPDTVMTDGLYRRVERIDTVGYLVWGTPADWSGSWYRMHDEEAVWATRAKRVDSIVPIVNRTIEYEPIIYRSSPIWQED